VPDGVARMTAQQFATGNEGQVVDHFDALKRILDREQPDYRE